MGRKVGLYDELITLGLARELAELERSGLRIFKDELDPADADALLSRHFAILLKRALRSVATDQRLERQVQLANALREALSRLSSKEVSSEDTVIHPPEILSAISPTSIGLVTQNAPQRPQIRLSVSDLLVNARGEPRIGHSLAEEIPSCDRIDLLCAFIRWNGLRIVEPALRAFLEKRRPLRVITTTYTGSTERRALDRLVGMGAEVKVSYETQATRLHAKAWLFQRDTGYSTAYVGSSNLSHTAMLDGLEWNVRLSEVETPALLEKFRATFESYWADPSSEEYRPERDAERFDRAVQSGRPGPSAPFIGLDVNPYPHQTEILERLATERERHDRHRNLVVAATGTGKTVVAALDYKRLVIDGSQPTLLFVAHRREILEQSLQTFRAVLKDATFGEPLYEGRKPQSGRHVFASIQSLKNLSLDELPAAHFEIVIVDEFHHAEAPTYRRLLDHVKPVELLGLTATPERADEKSILARFDGRMAVELRLWEALERGLLCPFQYFGLHDNVDVSHVAWRRRGYDTTELENLYTADDARAALVVRALLEKVSDWRRMRALGFCVSIRHAEFMADRFVRAGIPAAAVSANSSEEERDSALKRLKNREVNVLFAVDLFNEGIDLPQIDTVLFLRPTESATVFLQQLGRGLRRAQDKDCLTVLDFIGKANRNFRFDLRFRALTGVSGGDLRRQIEEGFPLLPAGCSMQLDRIARDVVLENVAHAIGSSFQGLASALRELRKDVDLAAFLKEADLGINELYRNGWTWMALRRAAGLAAPPAEPGDDQMAKGLQRLTHMDDPRWIDLLRRAVREGVPDPAALAEQDKRALTGMIFTLFAPNNRPSALPEAVRRLRASSAIGQELLQLLDVLEDRALHVAVPLRDALGWSRPVPLSLHSSYSLEEVLAASGRSTLEAPYRIREGVLWQPDIQADLFFVTLEKAEKHYSPTTLYKDYAVSPDLFHWESQSGTREDGPTGQRYVHHRELGTSVLLFVRRSRSAEGRTSPYVFLGPVDYVSHAGEKPMGIVWRLRRSMPADFYREAKMAAG
jgi:superfamily II DNA or RNA helicase/HKD family nuclease